MNYKITEMENRLIKDALILIKSNFFVTICMTFLLICGAQIGHTQGSKVVLANWEHPSKMSADDDAQRIKDDIEAITDMVQECKETDTKR